MPEILREKIRVPFCVESTLSGVMRTVRENQKMIYKRKFQVEEAWRGRRIKLIFQAVDYDTEVSLNGQLVGHHKGGQLEIFSKEVQIFSKYYILRLRFFSLRYH